MLKKDRKKKTKLLYSGGASTWKKSLFLGNSGTIKITNKDFIFDSNNLNFNKLSIHIPLDEIDYASPLPFPPGGAIAIKLNSVQEEYKFSCSDRAEVLSILNGEKDFSKRVYTSKKTISDSNKYNTTAILAFVLSFLIPIIPLILGLAALREIRESEERGKIYAQIAIGLSGIQLLLLFVILIFVF